MKTTIKKIVPYIVLVGIVLAIFTIGFVSGRLSVKANEVKITYTEPTIPSAVEIQPYIETLTPGTVFPDEPWFKFMATAYCSCEKCCGEWATKRPLDENGEQIVYGASGIVLQQGVSVAADTSLYPMGTQLEIEGMGTYTVHDRGGAIKDNRIDIYFENHQDAIAFGVQTVQVRVVK